MGNIIKMVCVCFVPQTSPTNVVWQCQSVLASKVQPRARIQCWASECSGQLLPSVPSARPQQQQQHRLIELLALLLGIIHSRSQLQILLAPLFFSCLSAISSEWAIGNPWIQEERERKHPTKILLILIIIISCSTLLLFSTASSVSRHYCPPLLIYLFLCGQF